METGEVNPVVIRGVKTHQRGDSEKGLMTLPYMRVITARASAERFHYFEERRSCNLALITNGKA